MKFYDSNSYRLCHAKKKILLLMKLTTILLFVLIVNVHGAGYAQKAITLNERNTPLEKVLDKISEQSGYDVFFNAGLIAKAKGVSIKVKDMPLPDVLIKCFANQPLSYMVDGNTIIVHDQKQKSLNKEILKKSFLTIKGRVTDETGQGIPNATVRVKGNEKVAFTDGDGYFMLKDLNERAILVISFVGYVSQEVTIENEKELLVKLLPVTSNLNEVVVVAFGRQKKAAITGSIATIQTKELKQSAVSNLSNALVGRLPGLFARQTSGEPGNDGSQLWLRGFNSFSSSAYPLILVDGVKRSGFSYVDANEVETISILKDAASTSVFGIEGANGVILVTTKRGAITSKPAVTANIEQAVDQPTYVPSFLNSADYFRLRKQGLLNDGKLTEAAGLTDEIINRYDRSVPSDPALMYKYLYPDVNWYGEIVKKYSLRTSANINVTGGNAAVRYFVSGSYLKNNGLYKPDKSLENDWNPQSSENRFNFRSNIDADVNRWISIELSLATIVSNRDYPGSGSGTLWNSLYRTPSYVFPIFNPNGTISEGNEGGEQNPYAQLNMVGYGKEFRSYLQGTVGTTFKLDFILKGLSVKDRFSYDFTSTSGYSRTKSYFAYRYNGPKVTPAYTQVRAGQDFLGYGLSGSSYARNMTNELYLNYDNKFKKHNISFMSMFRIQNNNLMADNAVGALPYRTQSLISRLNYDFADKYFFQGVFTISGSENFAPGNRTGYFPAFSAGWLINRENFMKDVAWIDLLKLRIGAGKVGVQGDTRFAYQSRWSLNSGLGYTFGEDYTTSFLSASPIREGNSGVTWETETNYNLGLDLDLFKGMIQLDGDVFYRKRTNIFTTSARITPVVYGIPASSLPSINAGIVENKGFEVSLSHNSKLARNLFLKAGVQWSYATNKILEFVEPVLLDRPWQQTTGVGIDTHFVYKNAGYFQSQSEINSSPIQNGVLQPGDIKYIDINNDGRIDNLDQTYIGKLSQPNHVMGFNASLRYKNIDLSVLFQGALGRWVDIRSDALFGKDWLYSQLGSSMKDNYWTVNRTDARYPRISAQKNENNTASSDFWLRSADYLRFKNFEIGYNFPQKWMKSVGINKIRIYANGNNLFTWDKLDGLYDPEADSGNAALTYPILRTYNFGIQVGLQ